MSQTKTLEQRFLEARNTTNMFWIDWAIRKVRNGLDANALDGVIERIQEASGYDDPESEYLQELTKILCKYMEDTDPTLQI